MRLLRYTARRLAWSIPTVVGTLIVIFFLTQAIPGDAAVHRVGMFGGQSTIDQMRKTMGIDQPLPAQFLSYLGRLAHGDLGHSYKTGNSVNEDLKQRLPASFELAASSMLVAFPVGVGLGVIAAANKGKGFDFLVRGFGVFGNGIAVFWFGLMLIYIFYFRLDLAPAPVGRIGMLDISPPTVTGMYTIDSLLAGDMATFRSALAHLILPVLCLATVVAAPISRMTYSAMTETLRSNYVRAAIAQGLPRRRVLFKYTLKNAMIPIVTLAGQSMTFLIAGAILVEMVFAWPGIGRYAVESMVIADLAPVQAFVIFTTVMSLLINLLVDISYFYFDPRIRMA
ncbi:MAG: ABC transporter permease [Thermomicrobiales bacterium]|nr:ABC transporter permease [Thermomicrobiales bacterium]